MANLDDFNPLKPCWSCPRNPYEHQGYEVAKKYTDTKILQKYCSIFPCYKVERKDHIE